MITALLILGVVVIVGCVCFIAGVVWAQPENG